MKILYVVGHPYQGSFNHAIMTAFVKAAKVHNNVEVVDLSASDFDPVLRFGYAKRMEDEFLILRSKQYLQWADRIVFAFPEWWGMMPSVLSGWIARVFTPGLAYNINGFKVSKLLAGKTANVIITSSAPRIIWPFVGNGGFKVLKKNLFYVTGIKDVKDFYLDLLNTNMDSPKRRKKFLDKIEKYALELK